jgi:hypothetical protein
MKTLLSAMLLILFLPPHLAAQSSYSIRPGSSGSLLGGGFAIESQEEAAGATGNRLEERLDMRLRYPDLYGGNLAAGASAEAAASDTTNGEEERLDMQTRYPELYLSDKLFDDGQLLSIEGSGRAE